MKKQISLLAALLLSGCVSIPPDSFVSTPQLLKQRQIESRRYDGITEADLIIASANVLQDLGYNLENSETKLGVLTASKERDAVNGGEVVAAIAVAVLTGVAMPTSKDQTIRVALVVRPASDSEGKQMANSNFLRVTFQRLVRKTDNSVHGETLSDPQLYQDFYEKVSKSVFLEGQKL